jgi:flagellar hook-length control protein FliK
MMNTLPQTTAPSGLPSFLATLTLPGSGGSEDGGFGRLFATAPLPATLPAAEAMAMAISLPMPVATAIEPDTPLPGEAPLPPASIEAEAAAPDTAPPAIIDAETAIPAGLLIAMADRMTSAARPGETPTAKSGIAAQRSDSDAGSAPTDVTEPIDPALAWASALPAVAASVTPKPAKTDQATAPITTRSDEAPVPTSAARARETAPPLPGVTAMAIETPTAKAPAADGGASMSVAFAPPTAQGPSGIADMTKPAVMAERTLDMTSDDAWIGQLAADIAATKSRDGDISFRLTPRHLGRLDVAMQLGDEGVSLKLETQHEATATIVTAAQGRLVEDLRQQGVRVTGAEVTCTPDQTGRQSQGQGGASTQGSAHLIETAADRADTRDDRPAAERRGRFA